MIIYGARHLDVQNMHAKIVHGACHHVVQNIYLFMDPWLHMVPIDDESQEKRSQQTVKFEQHTQNISSLTVGRQSSPDNFLVCLSRWARVRVLLRSSQFSQKKSCTACSDAVRCEMGLYMLAKESKCEFVHL